MGFNIYSVWTDPVFYAVAAGFLAALFFLIYSIRRYVELKNEAGFEDAEESFSELPPAAIVAETTDHSDPRDNDAPPASCCAAAGDSCEAQTQASCEGVSENRAEVFVKGIYEGIAGLDARFKNIESALSKNRVNSEFTAKFLEDILADLGSLDKEKIKARIEYLLSDLKK